MLKAFILIHTRSIGCSIALPKWSVHPTGFPRVQATETRKQESLGTRHRAEAKSLLNARNEAVRQPQLNLQIAKAYLAGTDSGVSTLTWQHALEAIPAMKT